MKFAHLVELQSLYEAKSPVIDDKRYYVIAKKVGSDKLVIVMNQKGYENSEAAEDAYDEFKETIADNTIEDFSWDYVKGSELKKMWLKEGQERLTEGAGDLSRSIENWMDATKSYNFEGDGGVRNFTKLVRVLGYGSLDEFFADNSGAIEAVINWIGTVNVPEWKEKFAEFDKPDEDEDEDDEK